MQPVAAPLLPEYFLYPPFTPEQEQWIVQVGHPFKDYVLQTWQDQIHSSAQDSLRDLVDLPHDSV